MSQFYLVTETGLLLPVSLYRFTIRRPRRQPIVDCARRAAYLTGPPVLQRRTASRPLDVLARLELVLRIPLLRGERLHHLRRRVVAPRVGGVRERSSERQERERECDSQHGCAAIYGEESRPQRSHRVLFMLFTMNCKIIRMLSIICCC